MLLAYGKKCVYSGELVDPQSLHIDHVIPERLLDDRPALDRLLQQLQRTIDFDVRGFENLVVAKAARNLQKGGSEFDIGALHFFLNLAAEKKPLVEANLQKIRERQIKGMILLRIQQMLDAGRISTDDLAYLLAKPATEIFRLAEAMQLGDGTSVTAITKADLAELATRRVGLGGNADLDGVSLTNDAGVERVVRTCTEYRAALEAGFYALTTFAMTISAFFEHQCGLLSALEHATLPETSYVAEPRVGVADLRLLPIAMFPDIGEADGREEPDGVTYADKLETGELVVKNIGTNRLTAEFDGMGQHLIEAMRADFDGDGIEEILLFEYCYAVGGTLRFGGIRIVGRKSADGLLEAIDRHHCA